MIVDPPRKGCEPSLLQTIADMAPSRVVYVSCNPATLARDLRILRTLGYGLVQARPFDFFPRTAHVETVAGLVRKAPDDFSHANREPAGSAGL